MKKRSGLFGFIIASLFVASFYSGCASAETAITTPVELKNCIVNTTEPECTLAADFALTSLITIDRDVVINGNGHTLSRDGVRSGNLFSISEGVSVEIKNLTFDGKAPGWVADKDLDHIIFRTNAAKDRAYGNYSVTKEDSDAAVSGAVIWSNGNLTITNTTVKDIYCTGGGGFILARDGNLTIESSTFTHNSAVYGSAAYATGANVNVSVNNSVFNENNAGLGSGLSGTGGALNASQISSFTVKNSSFSNNSAQNDGGAIFIAAADTLIENNIFDGNISGNDGNTIRMGVSSSANLINELRTFVSKNNTYKNGTSLGYFWPPKQPFPDSDVPATGNSEGAFSYYNQGFETVSFENDTFDNNCGNISSNISIYDSGNVTLDNVSILNSTGAPISIRQKTEYSIDVSDLLIDNVAQLTGYRNIASLMAGNVTIDGFEYTNSALALRVTSTNASINDAYIHNNSPMGYALDLVPDSTQPSTATLSNSIIQNNTSSLGALSAAGSTSTAPFTININNTTITDNQASCDEEYDDCGKGGGFHVRFRTQNTLTINIDENSVIKNNAAEIAGNDIYVRDSDNENSIVIINANSSFFLDNVDARVDKDSERIDTTITLAHNQTLGLAYYNGHEQDPEPEPEPQPEPEPTPNPEPTPDPEPTPQPQPEPETEPKPESTPIPATPNTGDELGFYITLLCASSIIGAGALISLRKSLK